MELNPVSTCRLIASLNLDELKEEETGQLLKDFCEPHKSLSRLMTPALKVVWHHFLDAIGHAAVQCTLLGGAVAKKGTATTTSERGQRQASLIYCVEWKYFQRNFPLLPSMSKKVKKKTEPKHQVAKIHDIWKIIKNCISRKSVNIFLTYISRKNGLNLPPFSCQL